MAGLTRVQWEYLSLLVKSRDELESYKDEKFKSELYNPDSIENKFFEIQEKIDDLDPTGFYAAQINIQLIRSVDDDIYANLFLLNDFESRYILNLLQDAKSDSEAERYKTLPDNTPNHETTITWLVDQYRTALLNYLENPNDRAANLQLLSLATSKLSENVRVQNFDTNLAEIHHQLTTGTGLMVGIDESRRLAAAVQIRNLASKRGIDSAAFDQSLKFLQINADDAKRDTQKLIAFKRARKELLDAQYTPEYQDHFNFPIDTPRLVWNEEAEIQLIQASTNFIDARINLDHNLDTGNASVRSLKAEFNQLREKHRAKGNTAPFRINFDGLDDDTAANAEAAIYSPERVMIYQFSGNHVSQEEQMHAEKQRTLQEAYFHQLWVYEIALSKAVTIQQQNGFNLAYTAEEEAQERALGEETEKLQYINADKKAKAEKQFLLNIFSNAIYAEQTANSQAQSFNLIEPNTKNKNWIQLPDPETTLDELVKMGINLELELETSKKLTPEQRSHKNQQWNMLIQFSEIKYGPGALLNTFAKTLNQMPPKWSPSKVDAAVSAFRFLLGVAMIGIAITVAATSFGAGTPVSMVILAAALIVFNGGIGTYHIKNSHKQVRNILPSFRAAKENNRLRDTFQKFIENEESELKPSLPAMRAVKAK